MKKKASENSVSLALQADKQVINQDAVCTRIVEISITPPEKQAEVERAPLNLSLVLDRSGSMQGEKLHFVKQAAAHVIDLLDEKDTASVVIYDDRVATLLPPGKITDSFKIKAKSLIQTVKSGSSTFLSGGWLKGCELVATEATDNTINRTLLLTDGLANVGIQNIDDLATHARELFQRGVTTSCFGVGLGYDEHLLEAMANSGGGNFNFLETMNAIPVVFEREFEELILISLRDVVISVKVPDGAVADVSGSWPTETKNGRMDIPIGNLISGRPQNIYLKLRFENVKPGAEIPLPITVRGKGDDEYVYDVVESITLKAVPASDEESAAVDKPLLERFAEVDMADKVNEALKMERAGDRAGASRTIRNSIHRHQNFMPSIEKEKFEVMANEASSGMDELQRKRYHREEYETKRGREIIRDYQLELVNGHLITRIEEQFTLLDTGIPISIGKASKFYFSNRLYELSSDYLGVSMDYLERTVGTQIDIMMGTDILKQHHITIDLPAHRLHFGERTRRNFANRIPMTNFMGAPSVAVSIGGTTLRMVVDTGARLSYVDSSFAANYPAVDKEKDFYPGLGEFETDVYEIPLELGNERFTLRCGVLPELLETTLRVTGNKGIIGTELYQKFIVCLAFPEDYIYLEKIR